MDGTILIFGPFWYGPFLHLGRIRMGHFCIWAVLEWAVFIWYLGRLHLKATFAVNKGDSWITSKDVSRSKQANF